MRLAQSGESFPLFAPHITTLKNYFGYGTDAAAAIRNSTAMVRVHDAAAGSILKEVAINEHRADGHRRVENFLTYTEDLTHSDWVKSNATVSAGVSDPVGGNSAFTVAATSGNGNIYQQPIGINLNTYSPSIYIRRRTGTGNIQLYDQSDAGNYITIPVTSEWQRLAVVNGGIRTTQTWYILRLVTSGDAVDVWHPQSEIVTGLDNQNPSEYVSDTDSPNYFTNTNGNTVASNVVTEANGDKLFPTKSVGAGIWNDTKPYWPASTAVTVGTQIELDGYWHQVTAIAGTGTTGAAKPTIDTTIGNTFVDNAGANQVTWQNMGYHNNIYGLLTEPARTNSSPANHRLAASWVVGTGTSTAANDAVGIDGVPNSAVTITDTDAGVISGRVQDIVVPNDGNTHALTIWVKKSTGITMINARLQVGTAVNRLVRINQATGELSTDSAAEWALNSARSTNTFWCLEVLTTNNSTGNTTLRFYVYPSSRATINGADDATLTGDVTVDWPQVELDTSIQSSPIDGTATRATEAGTIEWSITDNQDNDAGVCVVDVLIASDKAASAAIRSVVSLDTAGSFLYQNIASGAIDSTDGTTVTTNTTAYVADKVYRLAIRWNSVTSKKQIGLLDLSTHGAAWVWGTENAYDGAFALGSLIELAITQLKPLTYRNLPIIYGKDMTTAQIEAKF